MKHDPRHDVQDSADFVVVGSGAAGATAARWLAGAGHSVAVVEAGSEPVAYPFSTADALKQMAGGGAWRAGGGDDIALHAGRCLGGSTAIGYGAYAPLTGDAHAAWTAIDPRWADRMPWEEAELARSRIEADLSVRKTPASLWGVSGRMLFEAMQGGAESAWRAAPGCRGTGRCVAGCPTRGLASADRALLPIAQRSGAKIHSNATVGKITVREGRAVGIEGIAGNGGRLRISAKRAVFVCAGALQTPGLLVRSGVRAASFGLQMQVEALVAAALPEPIDAEPAAGLPVTARIPAIPQATVDAVSVLPRLRATLLPGAGLQLERRMELLENLVVWRVTLACEARGAVGAGNDGPRLLFQLTARDRQRLHAAIAVASDGLLRAGAAEVYPRVYGAPDIVAGADSVESVARAPLGLGSVPLTASAFFGGLQLDDRYQVAGVKGLVVCDATVLPAAINVPPAGTIMGVAMAAVQRWV